MKLFLVRHGETDANKNRVFQGWLDLPLNATGQKQARDVRDILQQMRFAGIFASPLQRTMETATIIQEGLQCQANIFPENALKEMNFGLWDGLSSKDIEQSDGVRFREWLTDWEKIAPPAGESAEEMYQRVSAWLGWLKGEDMQKTASGKAENAENTSYLIVTHEGVILQILAHLLGLNLSAIWHFRVQPGSISEIQFTNDYAVLTRLNYTTDYPNQ